MSTIIHETAFVGPNVSLGENVKIYPYAVIGTRAEHRGFMDAPLGKVIIGSNCVIREFTTINAGTTEFTVLENDVWMLRGSHVGHDAYIEKGVTLSCNVIIGGHSRVFNHSNLGMGAVVHQRCAVPPYTMLGMNSTWTKRTPPMSASTYVGSPARRLKENTHAIKQYNLEPHNIFAEQERYKSWLKKQRS